MLICTIASGSSGNCLLLSHGKTHILVDAGISARRIRRALEQFDLSPEQLSAIVVTHEHSDHISGLPILEKHFSIPIWTSLGTARQLQYRIPFLDDLLRPIPEEGVFSVGELSLRAFSTPHDAADSMGYLISDGVHTVGIVTDLGHVTDEVRASVRNCDALVLESNHDVRMLQAGPYPYPLKKRILGRSGHLRNEDAASLARDAAMAGARYIILAHLSQENNTPELAFSVTARALTECGADTSLFVAPRNVLGDPCVV